MLSMHFIILIIMLEKHVLNETTYQAGSQMIHTLLSSLLALYEGSQPLSQMYSHYLPHI